MNSFFPPAPSYFIEAKNKTEIILTPRSKIENFNQHCTFQKIITGWKWQVAHVKSSAHFTKDIFIQNKMPPSDPALEGTWVIYAKTLSSQF